MCGTPTSWRRRHTLFSDPRVLLAYHNAVVSSAAGIGKLHSTDEEEAALREQPMAPFKSPNGLLMLFRADLRRFDDLWDMTTDQNEGDVVLAHDQWYFFLARALGGVRFIDEPLLVYRQHESNTLGVTAKPSLRQRIARRLVHFGTADEWAARSAQSRARVLRIMRQREGEARLGPRGRLPTKLLAQRRRRRGAIYCRKSASGRHYRAGPLLHCGRLSGRHLGFQTGVHRARSLERSGSRQMHRPDTNFVMRLCHSRTTTFSRLN